MGEFAYLRGVWQEIGGGGWQGFDKPMYAMAFQQTRTANQEIWSSFFPRDCYFQYVLAATKRPTELPKLLILLSKTLFIIKALVKKGTKTSLTQFHGRAKGMLSK